MSRVSLTICSRLSSDCSSLRGPIDDHDPEGAGNFCLTSSTEHQKPELVGLPGADLKACPAWFQPQPVQTCLLRGRHLRAGSHTHSHLTLTQSHPQTRPLAWAGEGAATPSTEGPALSCFLHWVLLMLGRCPGDGKLELLPWFWGWVLTESKTLWAAASRGRAFSLRCVCWVSMGVWEGLPLGTAL